MFLHLSVILSRGVCLFLALITGDMTRGALPFERSLPSELVYLHTDSSPPPPLDMTNQQSAHILLECNLVIIVTAVSLNHSVHSAGMPGPRSILGEGITFFTPGSGIQVV